MSCCRSMRSVHVPESGLPTDHSVVCDGLDDVYVEYCYPAGGATQKSTLMMTHGIGFDYSYWSFNTTSNGTQYK